MLIGHGASLHKRVAYVVYLARHLVGDMASPRPPSTGPSTATADPIATRPVQVFGEFPAEWSRPATTDDMVVDWQGTLDALRKCDDIGEGPVGYWGLSMGSIYGLPFVAADARIDVAVLGLLGLVGPRAPGSRPTRGRSRVPCCSFSNGTTRSSAGNRFSTCSTPSAQATSACTSARRTCGGAAEEFAHSVQFLVKHLTPTSATTSNTT